MTININLNNVQETLVNQTNIKSINGQSILGSGDLSVTVDKVENVVKKVKNTSGGTLQIGTAVRIVGATGQNPNVNVANATSGGVPDRGTEKNIIFGITTQTINNNAVGEILIKGTLKNYNTQAFNVGDFLFLPASGTTYTTTPPAPPAYAVCLGLVIKKATDGEVCVNVQEPIHINDVTGLVMNRATLADRQAMIYDGAKFVNRLLEAADIGSGTLAAARLPLPTTTDIGGVKRNTGSAGQFVSGIDSSGNLEYSTPTGGGDVTGAASSVNNNIAVFDGTTGKVIKDGGETIASINSSISGKQDILSEGAFVNGDKTKLDGIAAGAQVNTVTSVATKTGAVTLDKNDVGLGNVDNTSDVNKPISSATQTALDAKEGTITAGTTGQYFRGDKTFQTLDKAAVGLSNVANVDQQNADNITSGTLGGARLPAPTTTVLGGVKRNTGSAGQFVSGISNTGDLEYNTPTGGGDVTGAASSVNNNIAVFDGTTGKIIKDGGETIASINSSISAKENTITATTSADYYRGDKTFQTLNATAVGLGNVDNTSDANKPISSATQTALDAKEGTITATTSADYYRGDKTFQPLNATAVGLSNVANVDQQNADNITSGTLGGARLPNPTTTVLGGVKRNTGSAGEFVSGIDASGNLTYSTPTGGGDVTGAASSVNNNIAVFDGTTGKIIKDGGETIASINSSIGAKENAITATTSADYYRGDKTFQPLNSTAVGLGNVDNTSDANKPISSATQTALDGKEGTITATTSADYYRGDKTFQPLNATAVGLGNVDNTSDANKPISSATQTALDAKEGTITATTSADYYRGDKTFQPLNATAVGLGNVANVDQQNADNITSGTLSGARLPNPQTTVLGGVKRNTGSAGQFVTGIDAAGELEYGTPAGGGDVVGPGSAVDNRIAVFDGTTGKLIKDGGVTIAEIGGSVDELQVVLLAQVFS